jgi:hypothetical protein
MMTNWFRKHWFGPFSIVCLTIIGTVLADEIWVNRDFKRALAPIEVLQIGVIRIPCGEKHWWGHVVLYREPGREQHWGWVCRDWFGQRWVLNDDKPLH